MERGYCAEKPSWRGVEVVSCVVRSTFMSSSDHPGGDVQNKMAHRLVISFVLKQAQSCLGTLVEERLIEV